MNNTVLSKRLLCVICLLSAFLTIVFALLNAAIAYNIVVKGEELSVTGNIFSNIYSGNTQKSYEDTIDEKSIFVNYSSVEEIKD